MVHPPCHTERFRWIGNGDYYVSTARLEIFKRVDLIIDAFKRMPGKKLVVISEGSEKKRLKQKCQNCDNILFKGGVTDKEMLDIIGRCIATIYIPIDEDFGLSPVESMAAGKPVIGVAEGGLLETIVPGETGVLLPANPEVSDIMEAVNRMTPEYALPMRAACEERAKCFGKDIFIQKIKEVLQMEIGEDVTEMADGD